MGSSREKRRPVRSARRGQVLCRTVTASSPSVFSRPRVRHYLSPSRSVTILGLASPCALSRFIAERGKHCELASGSTVWYLSQVLFPPRMTPSADLFFLSPLKFFRVDSSPQFRLIHSSPCSSCSLLSEGSVMYASICVDYLSFPTTIPHSLVVTQT